MNLLTDYLRLNIQHGGLLYGAIDFIGDKVKGSKSLFYGHVE
ncbi:hypothetical protein ACTJIJ_15630 [Niabella sp. 22666]